MNRLYPLQISFPPKKNDTFQTGSEELLLFDA